MQSSISSKNFSVIIQQDEEGSHQELLQKFVEKANHMLDDADQKIQNLIDDLGQIIGSQENITMVEKSLDENRSNDSFWYERQNKSIARENSPQAEGLKKAQKPTLVELSKKKQNLLHKLKDIDKELLEQKFQPPPSIKELRELKSPKHQKQNSQLGQDKGKLPKLGSIKNIGQNQGGAHRTLQLMDQLNRQKIKRHEDMIQRMQIRQQEQLKKIRQLEQRRIKIELKKNNLMSSSPEHKSAPVTCEKRSLPALPKKVF